MASTLKLVNGKAQREQPQPKPNKIWRERPVSSDIVFQAVDEAGRSGWFVRLCVSGMYPRRIGPYRTKDQAVEALENFAYLVETEAFIEIMNDTATNQAYVIEGVPTLKGR